jgi:sigma-E factor negative regulatory protein RseA
VNPPTFPITETMNPPSPVDGAPSPAEEVSTLLALSCLIDGEESGAGEHIVHAWRDDAAVRERWHAWHLVSEILRSDKTAVDPADDAAFLARLRGRLAAEATALQPPVPGVAGPP